ncbi:MAG: extracellular solute-binding protein [Acidimicrobiia bacterium]
MPRFLSLLLAGAMTLSACTGDGVATSARSAADTVDPADGGTSAPAADAAECDPDGVTITTAHISVGDSAVETAAAVLEERYPGLAVESGLSSAQGYDQLTQQVVADLAAGREIDVVQSGNSQVRFYVDTYKPQPIDVSRLRDSYDQRFLGVGTVEGEVYMAPFQVSIPALYYNRTMMADAGLDPESPPATYSELFAAAGALADISSAGSIYVITAGAADWIAQSAVESAGGRLIADDGTAAFDTPEGREGLALYAEPAANGWMDPVGIAEGQAAFITGATPLFISSPAGAAAVAAEVGDAFEWGLVPMPIPDGGAPSYPAGGNGWLILTDDPCQAAFASELIAEMLDPAILAESLRTSSYVPVDEEARRRLLEDPTISPQQRVIYSYEGPVTPWGGWRGNSAPAANQILTDMVQQLANGVAVETAVAEAVAAIDEIVPR